MGKSLKGKELGRGIGQRKDGIYYGAFMNRFGKREYVYERSISKLQKKLREAIYNNDRMLNVVKKDTILNDFFDVWIETMTSHCRSTTIRTYKTQYAQVRDMLGFRKMQQINNFAVQEALNSLPTVSSKRHVRALLSNIFKCAIQNDLMIRNPTLGIKIREDETENNEKQVLSDSDVKLLLDTIGDNQFRIIVVLGLGTGMRIGEILGLTWDCVDFDNNMISVEKTLTYLPNNGNAIYEFHNPKTKNGTRKIPMSKDVKLALLKQKMWSNKVNTHFDPKPGFEDLVVKTKTNQPIHETNVRKTIQYYIRKINEANPGTNFKYFTPHCMRHTFATNCIEKGMKPKVLQKILGHGSLQMTMDLYCHVREKTMTDEMSLVMEMAKQV